MDHGVNRLINRKAADAGEGLSRYELPLEQAAMSDHRLDRLVKALARYTGLSASVLKERAEPLRLYSHIALRSSSGDRRVESCGGLVGASCFWRGEEAPEYAAVSVDSTGSDNESDGSSEDAEYYGEALLLFELRLKAANANGAPPPPEQLCYLAYLERVDALAPYQAYVYSSDPTHTSLQWCAVHLLSDVVTRVPLMPLLPLNADDNDEDRLYDVMDMHGIDYYQEPE